MEMSRKNYAQPKAEVEKAIKEWHAPEQKETRTQIKTVVSSPMHKSQFVKGNIEIKKAEENRPVIKVEQKSKENPLAKALGEAIKQRSESNEPKADFAKSHVESKRETISLNQLKPGAERSKNKEPSAENKNALREALEKAKNSEVRAESKEKENPSELRAPSSKPPNEIPEETLRKILKGE